MKQVEFLNLFDKLNLFEQLNFSLSIYKLVFFKDVFQRVCSEIFFKDLFQRLCYPELGKAGDGMKSACIIFSLGPEFGN